MVILGDHQNRFTNFLREFLVDGSHADAIVVAKDGSIHCHLAMLAAAATSILRRALAEAAAAEEGFVRIVFAEHCIAEVKSILDFLYGKTMGLESTIVNKWKDIFMLSKQNSINAISVQKPKTFGLQPLVENDQLKEGKETVKANENEKGNFFKGRKENLQKNNKAKVNMKIWVILGF